MSPTTTIILGAGIVGLAIYFGRSSIVINNTNTASASATSGAPGSSGNPLAGVLSFFGI